METITFTDFCQKVAKVMDLDLVPMKDDDRRANTMRASERVPNPKVQVCFSNLTYGDACKPDFLAEFYDTSTRFYLGAVGTTYDDNKDAVLFEHFEVGVSPSGRYDENNDPVEVDGELWQFYEGCSLAWAVKSFKMGGARSGRKPIRKW